MMAVVRKSLEYSARLVELGEDHAKIHIHLLAGRAAYTDWKVELVGERLPES